MQQRQDGKAGDTGAVESVRGVVYTWDCDAVEHFTTAAYFKKLSSATARLLQRLGHRIDDAGAPWTQACRARFIKELRVGDVYHIRSGVVGNSNGSLVLGHKLFNSETDALCTTFLQTLSAGAKSDAAAMRIEWDDDEPARDADHRRAAHWIPTSAAIVRPEDVDWAGRFDLGALINQLSAANIQCQTGFGMSPSYMRAERRGYSTAEYQLALYKVPPGAGAVLDSRSAVVHVGRTSLWFMHELYDRRDDTLFARLAQLGVHLDLDARKPSPLPDAIRTRAMQGLAP